MNLFSDVDPVTISIRSSSNSVFKKWPCLSRAVRTGAKALEQVQRIGNTVLSPTYHCVKYPVRLIGRVMRLLISPWMPWRTYQYPGLISVNSLEGAQAVLKQHRNGGMFRGEVGFDIAKSIGVSTNALILECEQDRTKHLRGIFQDLFGSKEGRQKVSSSLQQLLPRIQLGVHESSAWMSGVNGVQTGSLSKKIALGVVLGLQLTQAEYEECAVYFRLPQVALDTAKKLRDLHRNAESGSIWDLMEKREYTLEDEAATLVTILSVVEENVSIGLDRLLLRCANQKDLFAGMRAELEALMEEEGITLEEAARKSDLVQSTCVEGLRIEPVVSFISRVAAQELDAERFGLPKERIQPDRVLGASIGSLAQNEALVGAEPKKFCPVRYTGKNREEFWPAHEFLPFGYGPHQCPAWWLYKEVAVQVIAYLAYHYNWVPAPDGTLTPVKRYP